MRGQHASKVTTLSLILLALCLHTTSAQGAPARTRSCRFHYGLSRCTESPLELHKSKKLWCPYHVCGASFIPARRCARKVGERATHRCSVTADRRVMFKCLKNRRHRIIKLPVYCRGTQCKTEVRACQCKKMNPKRNILVPIRKLKKKKCNVGPRRPRPGTPPR